MSATATAIATTSSAQPKPWQRSTWLVLLTLLPLATLLINGYHPFAEDGGLYVAGVRFILNPTLFPHYNAFVTEHLHFSVFAPVLALLVHLTHLSLDWILLFTNFLSLGLTFFAAHRILQRTIASEPAQLAALCLLATFWSLPIAGTALFFMDPYVTGRSLSTPLGLLAIAFALDMRTNLRPLLSSALCLVLAAAFHPLMAAYAFAFVICLRVSRLRRRFLAYALLTVSAIALAATLQALAPPESAAVLAAEKSRYYWFLSQWQWFEWLGLAGPLAVLTALLNRYRKRPSAFHDAAATLCRASIALGSIGTLVALLFAHEGSRTHLVARMQPLRVFLLIYAVMTILSGATVTELALEARRRLRSQPARIALATLPFAMLLGLAAIMFSVQRQTFPASPHIELPWRAQQNPNPWVQAFLWCRDHTPPNALFALDAKYVNEEGEDAQTFRPIAIRSALPDFSKDGGEAAITPSLATQWQEGSKAQAGLSTETDAIRDARLRPLHVTWMVLHAAAASAHPCPYNNGIIKVCSL